MKRIEPPSLATWMLEHCIPGRRNDALAGDLLEAFQSGRSEGWYWRQVLAACAVGWMGYLGGRGTLLVFAAMWSLLAPAWSEVIDRVQNRNISWPVSVAAWLGLNLAFLWAGMFLYVVVQRTFVGRFQLKRIKGPMVVAAGVFLPAYFATFVVMNLFAWPGFEIDRHGMTPLHEIADFRVWADVLRIPYFVTILWAMWGVARISATMTAAPIEWKLAQGSSAGGLFEGAGKLDSYTVRRMLAYLVGAGLLNALIAGVLLCRLPEDHHPGLWPLVARAALYVVIGAIGGAMGTYIYWHHPSSLLRKNPPMPYALFSLACLGGWIWVPAMVILAEQTSAGAALVAMAGALILAGELRRIDAHLVPLADDQNNQRVGAGATGEMPPLFVASLYRAPGQPYGYVVALAIYGAGWAIAEDSTESACLFLALAAAVFAWQRTFVRSDAAMEGGEHRRVGSRVARMAIPAVLVTMWALMAGVEHRNHLEALAAATGTGNSDQASKNEKKPPNTSAHGGGGYVSLILTPFQEKKQIAAPIPPSSLLAPGATRPTVIRFDGEYWYLQPPDQRPGPMAHKAHGTPLETHIASNNSFPLIMEAHEPLGTSVPVARCREVQVEIENREREPGLISMAVLLTDSLAPGKPAVYLGQQAIASTEPGAPHLQSAVETLRFPVPKAGQVRKFDEITVMVLPDTGHQRVGPRIAVQQFQLLPR